ncbi:MAG: hypothetical protein AAB513_00765 [Patescibacteria group bacterium]
MEGCRLIFPREVELPMMLSEYRASKTEFARKYKRPITILTIPGAIAFFIPGGNVAVFLPEFRSKKCHFLAGKEVLEISDLEGAISTKNYWTCPACYRLTNPRSYKRVSGKVVEVRNNGRTSCIVQCTHCTHEWELGIRWD